MARLMKNSDGFTIVEVAVTLVIIGIFSIVILIDANPGQQYICLRSAAYEG